MKKVTIRLWCIILLFSFTFSFAKDPYQVQTPDPLTESWRYVHFEALDNKGVRAVAKDNKSNVYWFGLSEGVAKYDGVNWKYFKAEDGIPGTASHIYIDGAGTVYVATSSGVFHYSGSRWQSLLTGNSGDELTFHSLTKFSDGSIFCTLNSGALLFSGNQKYFLPNGESGAAFLSNYPQLTPVALPGEVLPGNNAQNFSDAFEYTPGVIWLAISIDNNEGEILQFDLEEAKTGVISSHRLLSKSIKHKLGNDQKIFRASDHTIWIINKSNKVATLTYANNEWTPVSVGSKFGDDEYAVSIAESADGTIWIGGIGKVYSFKDKAWKKYSAPSFNIPAAHITTYCQQTDELMLLGFQSNVIKIDLSNKRWLTYLGLNYQCEMSNGATWFLEANGKAVYNFEDTWISYDLRDGLIAHPVRIFISSNDKVWAFGSDDGVAAIAYLENGRWHKMHFPSLSWGIDYRAVLESADGSLWFGGSVDIDEKKGQGGGLIQILNPAEKEKKWIHHKYNENGLQQSSIYGIGQTKNGFIWIGGVSLHNYDGAIWHRSQDKYFNQFVNVLYSDDDQNLYVGSRYFGVFIYDNESWARYSTENGLCSNTIISIGSKNNKLWVATEKDISYFDGRTWINNAFPPQMNLTNEGGSIHINKEGEIWINHSLREWKRRAYSNRQINEEIYGKFKVFRKIPDNNPPQTNILVYPEYVDNSGNTLISWTGEDYLNQTPSSILRYSYRLNGGEWSEFSKDLSHTFTGLKNGFYSIEVRAMDIDGNIDPSPSIAEFEVLPPVWKQTWFIVLIAGFIILIFIFEYRIISKNKKLSVLNISLRDAVTQLESKKKKIENQNEEIIKHQRDLEQNNQLLESKNHEIEAQRDALKDLVVQIETLSRAKVKFFTNITHEFRTPLSLILGPVETLTKAEDPVSEKFNLYQIIKRNALRLQKLINQLLEIRRIETGTMELTLRRENIVKFVRDIKELFNNQSMQKFIQFTFTSDINHYDIYFDQDKIEKIVFNLLSNAFKYTQDYGKISVSISINHFSKPKIEGFNKDLDKFIIFTVKDTGKGIEPERLAGIFERFKSADISLAVSNMQSTGIGLSYIKELVEFHEGRIFVESRPGEGTTFTILIPKNLQPSGLQPQPVELTAFDLSKSLDANLIDIEETETVNGHVHEDKIDIEKYSLLIVEDNEDIKVYLKSLLKSKYNIITAKNGKEGLEKLSQEEIDLIISDIMMPEFDGLKLCKEVKSNFETSHIPVLLLTAKTLKKSELTGYESGADDYITKPFDPEILELKIKNIFDTREKLKARFMKDFKFKPKEIKVTSADEQLLNRMVELMEEHISDADFDVNKMCDMVNLSHMHFIRKVKQLTGKKPVDLLKSFRLQRAKQLLEQDKLNISEIAYMVGYDLPNSFSRAFKKEFGISPTEFVNEQKMNML